MVRTDRRSPAGFTGLPMSFKHKGEIILFQFNIVDCRPLYHLGLEYHIVKLVNGLSNIWIMHIDMLLFIND